MDSDFCGSDVLFDQVFTNLKWEGCVSEIITYESFASAVVYHRTLPFSIRDFYFADRDNDLVILMDGFIYNSEEILRNLSIVDRDIAGPQLVSLSFIKWGDKIFDKLNGDFAICIYCRKNNELFLARDHVGLRPLAFHKKGSLIYFSTDSIGLCKSTAKSVSIQLDYIYNFFYWNGADYSVLPTSDVEKVLPGHYINFTQSGTIRQRYWFPEKIKEITSLSQASLIDDIQILLSDSVRIRSDHRLQASAHVSGGLDSGLIAALARKEYEYQDPFCGFSYSPANDVKSEDVVYDERQIVNKICDPFRIDPVFINLTVDDFLDSKESWRYSVLQFYEKKVITEAMPRRINLIFTGWGGDEFLSSGNRGIDADLIKKLHWRTFLKKYPITKPRRLIYALIYKALFPSLGKPSAKERFNQYEYQYFRDLEKQNTIPRQKQFSLKSRRKIHLFLLSDHHLAARVDDWYVLGQRSGIEYRYPLLDKRLIEYMLSIPSHKLVMGNLNRIILRVIGRDLLPNELIDNPIKNDPVRDHINNRLLTEAGKLIFEDLEQFKADPELKFIDFELLERNIEKMYSSKQFGDEIKVSWFLLSIKHAHDFIHGFTAP